MSGRAEVIAHAGRLAAAGEPYVLATVIDVVRPASCRRGDRALVTADGVLVGWVGGACAEPIVVREALRALAGGDPRTVRIGPSDALSASRPGLVLAESHCASEGIVELFLEPELPPPRLVVVGATPAAETLTGLARRIGWRVERELGSEQDAVVVATMGHGDEDALAAALSARIGYVGLVASARRAVHILGELRSRGLDEEDLARVRSPAGLDLGPCSQEEIAVAVLAELVAWRHGGRGGAERDAEAIDPVCGMTVAATPASEQLLHDGETYYFCCPGCRRRFERNAERYLEVAK